MKYKEDRLEIIKDIDFVDYDEFESHGFLQEINRRFLHPLGMALVFKFDYNTNKYTGIAGIIHAECPEGYVLKEVDAIKYGKVEDAFKHIARVRIGEMGYSVQPPPECIPMSDSICSRWTCYCGDDRHLFKGQ